MTMTLPPLDCQRALFSLPDGDCYLNSAYMGPLPRAVQQAGIDALALRATPIALTAQDFFVPAERTRGLIAELLHADAERIAFVTNAANAMAIVARNLQPRSGANLVLLGEMFPSSVHAWRDWRAQGVETRTVRAPAAPWSTASGAAPGRTRAALWNEAVLAAIDRDTMLVAAEPAHWTDGTLFDLDRIGARCREVGAAFVVDATQTAGVMPLDAQSLRADALVVHSYKSMLANYGLGFAVLGERFLDGRPL